MEIAERSYFGFLLPHLLKANSCHFILIPCHAAPCFLNMPFIILAGQSGFPGRYDFWTKALHELSLTLSLIEIAEEHARRENATAITTVIMEIGSLSGVIPEAVEFAFEACSQGTLADGARLEIRRIPALGRCQECGKESEMESLLDRCTACSSFTLDILKGQEMDLIEMEID